MMHLTLKKRSVFSLLTRAGIISIAVIVGVTFTVPSQPETAEALSGSAWKAGDIIDDGLFYDGDGMTTTQIQAWLNSRIDCDVSGAQTSEFGGGKDYNNDGRISRAEWARKTYNYTGKFVCLNKYYENPTNHDTNLKDGVKPAGGLSAATIIRKAAATYDINPKVLLVTLQKESPGPLTQDDWPLPSQFNAALGYGCPDPPAGQPVVCDPAYKGFYRQVMNAAKGMNNYKESPDSFRYKAFQNNTILYNPNTGCGSKSVYVENYATAGLYNYTPYQPNKAALDNLYGTGDSCSAYGNRNFWTLFHRFFGSTQSGYTEAKRVKGKGSSSTAMDAATSKLVSVKFKNMSDERWYDIDSVPDGARNLVLEATHVNGGPSGFNAAFASDVRATQRFAKVYAADGTEKTTNTHIVMPGQTVQFNFTLTADDSLRSDDYRLSYKPMLATDGATTGEYLSMPQTYYIKVNNDYQANRVTGPGTSSATLSPGETKQVSVSFTNTGTQRWYDVDSAANGAQKLILEATHINGTGSAFNAGFAAPAIATQRFADIKTPEGDVKTTNAHIAMPGQTVRFNFTITAPNNLSSGEYRLKYRPLLAATADKSARYLTSDNTFYITIKT